MQSRIPFQDGRLSLCSLCLLKYIQFYYYYLLENESEEGEWYVGEMRKNGNIEFYKCCETLEWAFDSL